MRQGLTESWVKARRREAREAKNLPLIEDKHFSWERVNLRVVRSEEDSVTCMTTTANGDIWCGAGWTMCVLATDVDQISKLACVARIPARGFIGQLVCLSEHVWAVDKQQPLLWAYNVSTHELKCVVDCSRMAADDVFPAAAPCIIQVEETSSHGRGGDGEESGQRASTLPRFTQREAALTTESTAKATTPRREQGSSALDALHAVASGADVISLNDSILNDEVERRRRRLDDAAVSDPNIQSIVVVRDTIWIGRRGGDILILDGNVDVPRVLTCLVPERTSLLYGCPVQSLTVLSTGLVVACREARDEERYSRDSLPSRIFDDYYCVESSWSDLDKDVSLDVWLAWGAKELAWLRGMQRQLDDNEDVA